MDNEVKGFGNATTALYWEYDPRIGRRWNLDPKPIFGLSPYSTFSNNPIRFNDPLGDTLSDPQRASALKIADKEIMNRLKKGQAFYNVGIEDNESLNKGIFSYIDKNSLNFPDAKDFQELVRKYYNGLGTMAQTNILDYMEVSGGVINNKSVNSKNAIAASEFYIQKSGKEFAAIFSESVKVALETVFAAGMPLPIGKGVRSPVANSKAIKALFDAGYKQSFIGDYFLYSKSNFSNGVFRRISMQWLTLVKKRHLVEERQYCK